MALKPQLDEVRMVSVSGVGGRSRGRSRGRGRGVRVTCETYRGLQCNILKG